jgi:hypothetical protein
MTRRLNENTLERFSIKKRRSYTPARKFVWKRSFEQDGLEPNYQIYRFVVICVAHWKLFDFKNQKK